jgi:hypothetical protein
MAPIPLVREQEGALGFSQRPLRGVDRETQGDHGEGDDRRESANMRRRHDTVGKQRAHCVEDVGRRVDPGGDSHPASLNQRQRHERVAQEEQRQEDERGRLRRASGTRAQGRRDA